MGLAWDRFGGLGRMGWVDVAPCRKVGRGRVEWVKVEDKEKEGCAGSGQWRLLDAGQTRSWIDYLDA